MIECEEEDVGEEESGANGCMENDLTLMILKQEGCINEILYSCELGKFVTFP